MRHTAGLIYAAIGVGVLAGGQISGGRAILAYSVNLVIGS
jgi:hypothetical protein